MSKRIAVLISGRGSNMISIVKACQSGAINGDVVYVLSNKKNAAGLESAAEMGIATDFVSHRKGKSREQFDAEIVELLQAQNIDLVCLAGFMRLLSPVLVQAYPQRIMNIHPSLLPSFPGLDAQWQAAEYGVKESGATVHFVDEELDHGPIILQQTVLVEDSDDGASLAKKILAIEHKIYPEAVRLYCADLLEINGRHVYRLK
jgi:phosphoribosylglycinamide formyltransferase-1